jgi:hypothetical protein
VCAGQVEGGDYYGLQVAEGVRVVDWEWRVSECEWPWLGLIGKEVRKPQRREAWR